MAGEATPAPVHDPPSVPGSPLPKRFKSTDPSPAGVSVACKPPSPRQEPPSARRPAEPTAAILNESAPTPTPSNPLAPPPPMAAAGLPTLSTLPPMAPMEPLPPPLQVKLLSSTARPPTRGSAHAAGYDLYASAAATVPARGRAMVETGISIAVPAGSYGRVAPRSGLASKHSIDTGAGVIDADYRGPVKVLLLNFGESDFAVEVGERIAQLIVERVSCGARPSLLISWRVGGADLERRYIPPRSWSSRNWTRLCGERAGLGRLVGSAGRCRGSMVLLERRRCLGCNE